MPHGIHLETLVQIMATLRAENGCPWDREQTLSSLRPFLIEEAYEVLEAMDGDDPAEHCDELGDLLFQIVFQSQIRYENGEFDIGDVMISLRDKLRRRHPHIFGDQQDLTREQVAKNWTELKAAEREHSGKDTSAVAGIPKSLPALLRAQRFGQKAAAVGFDWPTRQGVLDKVAEEMEEVVTAMAADDSDAIEHEIGDLLFSVVNLARHLKVEPETALQGANGRFNSRFRHVESRVRQMGTSMENVSLDELEKHWQEAKLLAQEDT